jgi:hypothetical protein
MACIHAFILLTFVHERTTKRGKIGLGQTGQKTQKVVFFVLAVYRESGVWRIKVHILMRLPSFFVVVVVGVVCLFVSCLLLSGMGCH